jgi:hypothetical protein
VGTPARRGYKKLLPSAPSYNPPKKRKRCLSATAEPPDYQADEVEFIMAMDRYKREKKRPFPTWSEVLAVLRGLGWKKLE